MIKFLQNFDNRILKQLNKLKDNYMNMKGHILLNFLSNFLLQYQLEYDIQIFTRLIQ
jgi:hypothetical protein